MAAATKGMDPTGTALMALSCSIDTHLVLGGFARHHLTSLLQARSTAVQKQLDSAAAELAELKAKQEDIEARTQHLGRCPSIKQQNVDAFISKVLPPCTATRVEPFEQLRHIRMLLLWI
jgi:hypothetical protein